MVVWSRERKNQRCRFWSIPLLGLRSLGDWKPHPTQKPVQLLRYLVEAYTQEGDTVFDPFVGSGTTAIACQQLKRHYIAIEKNPEFVAIADERLARGEARAEERRQRTAQHDAPRDETSPGEKREEQRQLTTDEDSPGAMGLETNAPPLSSEERDARARFTPEGQRQRHAAIAEQHRQLLSKMHEERRQLTTEPSQVQRPKE